MDDQSVEMRSEIGDVVPNQDSEPSTNLETDTISEKFDGDHELTNETTISNGTPDASSDQGQTLPILQKVIDLSSKIQNLKKEHAILSDNVKHSTSSFPDPESLNALQLLSTDHELLKNKYLKESSEHEILKKKYIKESMERKQFYNEVIELKGNIRVFCRCRPINQNEIDNGYNSIVEYDSSADNELQVLCSDSSKKQFKFNHVFKPEDNQEAVFAETKPIVTSVLDGYNVCIFAYGQTGTGKTFTMEGTPENRGVNYRTVEELFRISEERSSVMRYELLVSMLEVYNEKIRDLLVDPNNQQVKKLEIKQAADGTQEVPGLVEAHVFGTDDVWELLKSGSRVRSVGSTSANEMSSRSHCLLRVTVKGENLINGQKTRSHLWLVDLAGSERVGRIEVEGERLKESQFINKSLSALGDVISALASKTSHVPYRNSKLTHMLQSSLGGDCKTLMFVQISPSSSDQGETICSLNFATRVRGIESGPARKQADVTELHKYKQMAEKSKHDEKEVKKLQESLQSLQLRLAAREHTCRNLQDKIRDLECQLGEERKTRLKQESRALAAVSGLSLTALPPKPAVAADKKPPLAPMTKLRMPLQRISNVMLPPPSPIIGRAKNHLPPPMAALSRRRLTQQQNGKENAPTMPAAQSTKSRFPARRSSIAAAAVAPATSFSGGFKPRRRVSIATLRPELSSSSSSSYLRTPLPVPSRLKNAGPGERQSMMRDPRTARYSRLWNPLSELAVGGGGETTPVAVRNSGRKFMMSPPAGSAFGGGGGSNSAALGQKHAVAIPLQRKSFVWSPLKLRGIKQQFNRRPSLAMLPRRASEYH